MAFGASKAPKMRIPFPARVPGCVYTDLSADDLIPAPFFQDNERKLLWIGEADRIYRWEFLMSELLRMCTCGSVTEWEVRWNSIVRCGWNGCLEPPLFCEVTVSLEDALVADQRTILGAASRSSFSFPFPNPGTGGPTGWVYSLSTPLRSCTETTASTCVRDRRFPLKWHRNSPWIRQLFGVPGVVIRCGIRGTCSRCARDLPGGVSADRGFGAFPLHGGSGRLR